MTNRIEKDKTNTSQYKDPVHILNETMCERIDDNNADKAVQPINHHNQLVQSEPESPDKALDLTKNSAHQFEDSDEEVVILSVITKKSSNTCGHNKVNRIYCQNIEPNPESSETTLNLIKN